MAEAESAAASSTAAAATLAEATATVLLEGPVLTFLRDNPTLAIEFHEERAKRVVRRARAAVAAAGVGVGGHQAVGATTAAAASATTTTTAATKRAAASQPAATTSTISATTTSSTSSNANANATQRPAHLSPLAGMGGGWLGSVKFDNSGRINSLRDAPTVEMADSSPLLELDDGGEALFSRYEQDGYLLLRGLVAGQSEFDRAVQAVRTAVTAAWETELDVKEMRTHVGGVSPMTRARNNAENPPKIARVERGVSHERDVCVEFATEQIWSNGALKADAREERVWRALVRSPGVRDALNGPRIRDALAKLCSGASKKYLAPTAKLRYEAVDSVERAWLRLRGPGFIAPDHADYFYLAAHGMDELEDATVLARENQLPGSPPTLCPALWVALGPWPTAGGATAVLPGSHEFKGFAGKGSLDRSKPHGFVSQANGKPWAVTDLRAGDVLLVDAQAVSATTENKLPGFYRVSLDKRVVVRVARS